MHFLNKKNIADSIIFFPILWVFTGTFLYPDGIKMMVVFVLISALTSLLLYGKGNFSKNIKENKLLWLLGAYILFSVFAKLHYGYSSSLMRAFICLFIFLVALPPALATKIHLKHLVFIGVITASVYALTQVFILNCGRSWSINPIPYATFSATLAAVVFYYLLQCKSIKPVFFWLISFIIAIIPLVYSQSRGLWFALTIVILIILVHSFIIHKKSVYFLIPLIVAGSFTYYFSHGKMTQRFDQTKVEIKKINSGNLNSSIGLRFQMWKAAIILIPESPIIGLGDKHVDYKRKLAKKGIISNGAAKFTHYHNQFLNELVKYGLIGLILLLLSIIYPLYYLKKNNDENTWPGMIIIFIFILGSLTDVPYQHAQTFMFYFIFLYLTLGNQSSQEQDKKSNQDG